jgi:hypothetical protein
VADVPADPGLVRDAAAPRADGQGQRPGARRAGALADDDRVDQLVDGSAEGSAGGDAVQPIGRVVPDHHPTVEVGDGHRVGHDPRDLRQARQHLQR